MIEEIKGTEAYSLYGKVVVVNRSSKRTVYDNVTLITQPMFEGVLELTTDEGKKKFSYSETDTINNISCKE